MNEQKDAREQKHLKMLIYGAGVIGSLYAALLSEAGYQVAVFARGHRLTTLLNKGLLYKRDNVVRKARVRIIEKLQDKDVYDYIFLTVRFEQLYDALRALQSNQSPTIVTMVNSLDSYEKWEEIVGRGRILPAFPGAGGEIVEDVLDAKLTPWIIQPTTFGEIQGTNTERVRKLRNVFHTAHIPCQIVKDMHTWQICHLAMVVPLADAYYLVGVDAAKVGKSRRVMGMTAQKLKRNYVYLHQAGIKLSPKKMHLFRLVPVKVITVLLGYVYQSKFGDLFMYRHAMKAQEEMHDLHREFYEIIITF